MCGILAIKNSYLDKEKAISALHLMHHRGPDNTDYYIFENILLGHKRLSIIDLDARSNQPFRNDNIVMTYNGEVYNYKELITEHQLKVTTKSDTEVVLAMYRKYGSSCLEYFNGMFAFIIYDENTGDVFVARDRLGIKPLYYTNNGSNWIFASEIASILKLQNSEFDEFGIRQYRKLRMTIRGYTLYKDIKFFPPGHYMLNRRLNRYWDLSTHSKEHPNDDELSWLIEDAVRLRKRSDVAVGSYLSGGLDSSVLTAILQPQNTWTVGFRELNEFDWSDLANRDLNTIHHKTIVDKETFLKTTQWMINKRREPLSVPNEVLIYHMTQSVKKENTVVLSGEGADELFWGYDRIFRWAYQANVMKINEFDEKYCYGTHKDDEVLDFALEGIPGKTVLDKVGYYFQIHHLQGLLRRLDNSTMLCSVEARVPFVDHRLVELLDGVPFEWRMGKTFKEPLKRIFNQIIPQEIIKRKKVGFPVPLDTIFNEFKEKDDTPMDSWLNYNLDNLIHG